MVSGLVVSTIVRWTPVKTVIVEWVWMAAMPVSVKTVYGSAHKKNANRPSAKMVVNKLRKMAAISVFARMQPGRAALEHAMSIFVWKASSTRWRVDAPNVYARIIDGRVKTIARTPRVAAVMSAMSLLPTMDKVAPATMMDGSNVCVQSKDPIENIASVNNLVAGDVHRRCPLTLAAI